MVENIQVKGGAGEFEAAVIAVVLDQITADEKAAREGRTKSGWGLSAWVRAIQSEDPARPHEVVWPD